VDSSYERFEKLSRRQSLQRRIDLLLPPSDGIAEAATNGIDPFLRRKAARDGDLISRTDVEAIAEAIRRSQNRLRGTQS